MTTDLAAPPQTHSYWRGCRCTDCRNERNTYEMRRRKRRAVFGERRQIDATGTRRRVQALAVMGWAYSDIAKECGWATAEAVREVVKRSWVERNTDAKVRAAYDKLSMNRGPSTTSRKRALAKGWVSPLAWDDDTIDDPNATPDLGVETPRAPGQGIPIDILVENIDWLLRHNSAMTTSQLAARLGCVDKSGIQNALARHGHRDLLDRLKRNAEMAA